MLNCKQVAHKASDYVDQNMNGWQRFWLAVHLFMCVHCRRFVRHLRVTKDFVSKRPTAQASSQEVENVMAAVKKADQD